MLVAAIGVALAEVERLERVSSVLRGVLVFLIGFAVLAQALGLEVIRERS